MQRGPNRDRLFRTARLLRPLLGELVFDCEQVAELLVSDPAAVRIRPTDDVNVVVPVTRRTAYHALQVRLMVLGFAPDHRYRALACRMRTMDDLILSVMPLDEALATGSVRMPLRAQRRGGSNPRSRCVSASAAAFFAMKWEALGTRGADDPMRSHDLNDMATVVAGRDGVLEDVRAAPDDVRQFHRCANQHLSRDVICGGGAGSKSS